MYKVELNAEEFTFIVEALAHYQDALLKYKSWVETKEGKPLPAAPLA